MYVGVGNETSLNNTALHCFSGHSECSVPGEIWRRSYVISAWQLPSLNLLVQILYPHCEQLLLPYSEILLSLKYDNFLPTFLKAIKSIVEEVEITKELLWDEPAHSEPNEEENSRKNIPNIIYVVKIKINKKKLQKHIISKHSKFRYVNCVQRSLELRRNYSHIGYVYTLLSWFNCYLCNTLYNLQNHAITYEFQASLKEKLYIGELK